MNQTINDVTGILLAGGQSRRMGGGDKGLLTLAGKPMLQHVIDRIRPQVSALALNANGDPARFAAFGLPVFPDSLSNHPGPLAGVLAGMMWSVEHTPRASYIATVSTDAPFLPSDLVARLREAAITSPGTIAIARSGGHLHPVIGLWPVNLVDDLAEALGEGVRKVLRWTDRHGTLPVDFPFAELSGRSIDPFFNANTPTELEEARQLLTAGKPPHDSG